MALKHDDAGKARVGSALLLIADALKTYGKQPEQFESATKLFLFVLSDYPTKKIIDALAYYSKHYSDFPAPADIANIIERGNKPPFCKALYATLSKKDPAHRSSEEWEYLNDYERWSLRG